MNQKTHPRSVRLPEDVLATMDEVRGDLPQHAFILLAVESFLALNAAQSAAHETPAIKQLRCRQVHADCTRTARDNAYLSGGAA